MRRFHDPARYRIVLFDQRGSGRSTPHADLTDNTTWDLVADIEKLREHLGIERWQVFGGSWGSTLALAYAETHPAQVTELVLRGIFMLRRWELEWFYQDGATGCSRMPGSSTSRRSREVERDDLICAYHRRLTSPDEATRLAAARAWSVWEGVDQPAAARRGLHRQPRGRAFRAELRAHRKPLLRQRRLLRRRRPAAARCAPKLHGIPGVIVHGRYDVVCPVQNAWDLHQAWPEAKLVIRRPAIPLRARTRRWSKRRIVPLALTDILVRATDALPLSADQAGVPSGL